jgi:hypothetical protein
MPSYIDVKFTKPVTLKPGTTLSQLNGFFVITNISQSDSAISHNSATIVNGKVRLNLNSSSEYPLPNEQIYITYTPEAGKGLVDSSTPHDLKDLDSIKTIISNTEYTPDWGIIPTVTITSTNGSNGSVASNETINITFTLNTAVISFISDNVDTLNGALTNFVTVGLVSTAIFTPIPDNVCNISVENNAITSSTRPNNKNIKNTFVWTHKSAPVMTITSIEVMDGNTSNDATLSLIFTSTESTLNFALLDITAVGGSLSPLVGSDKVYTATFTPTGDGDKTIDVAASTFTDSLFNINNTASTQFNWTYDTSNPTMTIIALEVNPGSTSNDATLTLQFTSNNITNNFVLGDITFVGGTSGSLSGNGSGSGGLVDATLFTTIFTPDGDGLKTIDVSANTFTDAAGNLNSAASQFSWTYDGTKPTMDIAASQLGSGLTSNDATLSLTFTSSKTTSDFAWSDITVGGGTLGTLSGSGSGTDGLVDATIFTATFTPIGNGLKTIDVPANAFTDWVTNPNEAATPFSWTYDGTPPTISGGGSWKVQIKQPSVTNTGTTGTGNGTMSETESWVDKTGINGTGSDNLVAYPSERIVYIFNSSETLSDISNISLDFIENLVGGSYTGTYGGDVSYNIVIGGNGNSICYEIPYATNPKGYPRFQFTLKDVHGNESASFTKSAGSSDVSSDRGTSLRSAFTVSDLDMYDYNSPGNSSVAFQLLPDWSTNLFGNSPLTNSSTTTEIKTELGNWKIKMNYIRYPSSFANPSENIYFPWVFNMTIASISLSSWSYSSFVDANGVEFGRNPANNADLSFDNKPVGANVTFIPII